MLLGLYYFHPHITVESRNDRANNALGLGCGLSCADIDFPLGSKLSIQLPVIAMRLM